MSLEFHSQDHWQVVTYATVILRSEEGAEWFLASVCLVILQQVWIVKDIILSYITEKTNVNLVMISQIIRLSFFWDAGFFRVASVTNIIKIGAQALIHYNFDYGSLSN